MIQKPAILCLAFLLAIPPLAIAQTPEDPEQTADISIPNRFWQAKLPGGHFMVPLNRIVSVSRHTYLLDGAIIVDEVTVDTDGQALARFYFTKSVAEAIPGNTVKAVAGRAKDVVGEVDKRTGLDLKDMVIKKYPDTTHAKSIEYRLFSQKDLDSLYSSVQTAWESGRGRQFTVK